MVHIILPHSDAVYTLVETRCRAVPSCNGTPLDYKGFEIFL
jgi:hypothetical protein